LVGVSLHLLYEFDGDGGGGDDDLVDEGAELGVDFLGWGLGDVGGDLFEDALEAADDLEAGGGAVLLVLVVVQLRLCLGELVFELGLACRVFGEGHGVGLVGFLDALESGVEFGDGGLDGGEVGAGIRLRDGSSLGTGEEAREFIHKGGEEFGVFAGDVGVVLGACPLTGGVFGEAAGVLDPAAGSADAAVEEVGEAVGVDACVFFGHLYT